MTAAWIDCPRRDAVTGLGPVLSGSDWVSVASCTKCSFIVSYGSGGVARLSRLSAYVGQPITEAVACQKDNNPVVGYLNEGATIDRA